jgi:hypothetical protein
MFGKYFFCACLAVVVLVFSGCGASSSVNGGFDPAQTLDLDGGYEFTVSIEKGEVLALDMPVPSKGKYIIVGASFDPAILRLERYLEYGAAQRRARYLFTAQENGSTDVLVKMQPKGGGNVDVYKRVTVGVGSSSTLF